MSVNRKKLLSDAIADAQLIKKTAIANAQAALQEAFAPRIQSMLSSKLKEEFEDDEDLEDMEDESMADLTEEDDDTTEVDDLTLDAPEDEEEDLDMGDEDLEMGEDDLDMGDDEGVEDEELDIDLDGDDAEEVDTDPAPNSMQSTLDAALDAENDDEHSDEEKELEEILRELEEEDMDDDQDLYSEGDEMEDDDEEEEKVTKAELEEAFRVIHLLRKRLNEVNSVNTKLLYLNKLFRKYNLTESQKVKFIQSFDRAKSLREVKLVYSTLDEGMKISTAKTGKRMFKESYASKASTSTKPKQILKEDNQLFARMQELAGISGIKKY